MDKGSEKFLEIILNKYKLTKKSHIMIQHQEWQNDVNIVDNINDIIKELKSNGYIGGDSIRYIRSASIFLTTKGKEYFEEKEKQIEESSCESIYKFNNSQVNVFHGGNITGVQIQQGTTNSSQVQTINESIDYEKLGNILNEIHKYENQFDDTYGESSIIAKETLNTLIAAVNKKEEPSKIKILLNNLKEITLGVTGSLVATGILGLLSKFIG